MERFPPTRGEKEHEPAVSSATTTTTTTRLKRLSSEARARFFANEMKDWEEFVSSAAQRKKGAPTAKERAKERAVEEEEEVVVEEGKGEDYPTERQKLWLAERQKEVLAIVEEQCPPSIRNFAGYCVYTGAAGVALTYLRLHQRRLHHSTFTSATPAERETKKIKTTTRKEEEEEREDSVYLQTAKSYLEVALDLLAHSLKKRKHKAHIDVGMSFITGGAGVYAVAAAIYHHLGRASKCELYVEKLRSISKDLLPVPSDFGEWELLYGAGGYLYALYFVAHELKDPTLFESEEKQLLTACIRYGIRYAKSLPPISTAMPPLMYAWHGKEYLAVAHGIAGILMMFLLRTNYWPQIDTGTDETCRELIESTIDWLLTTRLESGNYPTRFGGTNNDVLVQWCHGAPAIALLLCKAHDEFRTERYVKEAKAIADHVIWTRGLLRKGVGLCHGISGNAYVFLYLYNVTKHKKYLYRAWKFAEFELEKKEEAERRRYSKNRKDERAEVHLWYRSSKPYSLFNGMCGAVCFYDDLLLRDSSQAYFPGCDLH
ncbi:mRNA decay protein [Balamuthia mandrillaris]